MKIAIIGAGISGLTAAYYLHRQHDITVFEREPEIGGHTATKDITVDGRDYAIDTGFIVFNDWTYPNFIKLMDELGVASQPTEMSFSVSCETTGLEYGGSNLNTLFAQRRNFLRPKFYGMLKDIMRFNREAISDLENGAIDQAMTLGDYLASRGYGEAFIHQYLVPMGCAIWSASVETMMEFPLLFFVRFFKNHGLLSVNNRPQWHVIKGGSRSYLKPLSEGFKDRIVCNAELVAVRRDSNGVTIVHANGEQEQFDQVVFGCHSDQALALLQDSSPLERELLGAIPYQDNEVILHTDTRLLPNKQRAWSSWNYWLRKQDPGRAVLTYDMNILQGIESGTTFCVTLNATDAIHPACILGRYRYSHPVFSLESVAAAERWGEINGVNRSWFAGAYWANGFHEDGVVSGLRVAEAINAITAPPSHAPEQQYA